MDKRAQVSIGVIVIVIMGIFAGLALLQEIFNQQNVLTDKLTVTNETLDISTASVDGETNTTKVFYITNNPTGWKISSCPITSLTITNSSGSSFTKATDYAVTEAYGNITFKNTVTVNQTFASDNLTYLGYAFCRDGYNKDSSSRGIARIIGLFAALGMVVFVLGYALKNKF